jgi:site-specific DNA recombinase
MMAPELVTAFIDEFNAEMCRLAGDAEAEGAAAQRAFADADRKIASIIQAIEDGAYSSALKERLAVLEKEKAVAAAKLAAATPQPVLRLHPNLPALYKNKVRQLTAALNEPGTAAQAGEIMRGLIDRIVLTPGNGSLKAELNGNLARLMAFAEPRRNKADSAGSTVEPALLSVVAGAGFGLCDIFNAQGLEPITSAR